MQGSDSFLSCFITSFECQNLEKHEQFVKISGESVLGTGTECLVYGLSGPPVAQSSNCNVSGSIPWPCHTPKCPLAVQ